MARVPEHFSYMKQYVFATVALLAFVGCRGTERAEAVEAAVEAAQMEGRTATREFVNAQWKDTMELQKRLLEVRAKQSKYVENKVPEAAAAFDTAFVNTLKTVRPDVARHLDKKPSSLLTK